MNGPDDRLMLLSKVCISDHVHLPIEHPEA